MSCRSTRSKGNARWCQDESCHFTMQPFVRSQSKSANMAGYNDLCHAMQCHAMQHHAAHWHAINVLSSCNVGWQNSCGMMQQVVVTGNCNKNRKCTMRYNQSITNHFRKMEFPWHEAIPSWRQTATSSEGLLRSTTILYHVNQCQGLSWTHGEKT